MQVWPGNEQSSSCSQQSSSFREARPPNSLLSLVNAKINAADKDYLALQLQV